MSQAAEAGEFLETLAVFIAGSVPSWAVPGQGCPASRHQCPGSSSFALLAGGGRDG